MNRRNFLAASTGSVLEAPAVPASQGRAPASKPIKVVLFDAFPLFDPRSVVPVAEHLYPENAALLLQVWRTRQFEYQWLRALGDRYVDFLEATDDSLTIAARQAGLDLSSEGRKELRN
jgi:2-haloacid dehalogenase